MEPRTIAVFGSAEPRPGDALYELARRVGGLLAARRYTVITGGYGGVMEGASRGAAEAGGATVGVGSAIFSVRQPNEYVGEFRDTPDLFVRTRELIDPAHGFIVLPGGAGTLAELAFLWALERAGCLKRRPVVLLGEAWMQLLHHLSGAGMLEPSQVGVTRLARTPEEAVSELDELVRGSAENGT